MVCGTWSFARQGLKTAEDGRPTSVMASESAIDALAALALAQCPNEGRRALSRARQELGEHADAFAPLLENLARRAQEIHQLQMLAGSDPLTGAANRRTFDSALDRDMSRRARQGSRGAPTNLAVILLDLDGLKQLNDQFGHGAGDLAICRLASAVQSAVRSADLVARLGGDEFAVLSPDTDLEGARILAERVRAAVEAQTVEGQDLRLSVGVAATDRYADADELLRAADRALYGNKRARKGRRLAA